MAEVKFEARSGKGNRWELEIEGEHRLRQENLAFDLDVWYPKLEEITFNTTFQPLIRSEALSIAKYYCQRFLGRPFRGVPFSTNDVATLLELRNLIDNSLKRGNLTENGAFLRLCGRSPKDSEPLDRAAVINQYDLELERLEKQCGYDPKEPNTRLMAVAGTHWLKVKTGDEALCLLLTSERVYADMRDWLDFGEPEQVCLRKWESRLTYDREFRLFCCHGKVTAITQYDHFCMYPGLLKEKDQIMKRLLTFWETQVHPRMIGIPSYVVDLGDLQENGVVLIELSPFLVCTGTALFNWKKDRKLLENGPLEFRLRTEPIPNEQLEALLESGWNMRWNTEMPLYSNWFANAVEASIPLPISTNQQHRQNNQSMLFQSFWNWIHSWFDQTEITAGTATEVQQEEQKPNVQSYLLFVYGTLKRGFHWNEKFLSRSEFICKAKTESPIPLVVGDCGVPYMLGDLTEEEQKVNNAKCINGEIWRINEETLEGLDEYEGVTKGHYKRVKINVITNDGDNNNRVISAECYMGNNSTNELRNKKFLDEYTIQLHKAEYNPILHILVKQQLYLGCPLTCDPILS